MAFISRVAFKVDDYCRVVDIQYARLARFDRTNWRPSYNALIVLEHLMTHGPISVAGEFQDEKSSMEEMQCFQHIDENGFNWGLAVRKKAERLVELLDKGPLSTEERNKVRKVTREIQGFGSFSEWMFSFTHGILQDSKSTHHDAFGRSHSQFNEHGNQDYNDDENYVEDGYTKANSTREITSPNSKENTAPLGEQNPLLGSEWVDTKFLFMDLEDHPFNATEKQSRISLLDCSMEDL